MTQLSYFLYRHIRLDKNEPFYIGIGKKPKIYGSYEWEYKRAFETEKRNKIWKSIFNKTKYIVEILLESDDVLFIKEKEKEFIKLYGRIDLNTGTLTNLTDGGDGCKNFKPTKEQIQKMKNYQRGKSKKVILMDLYGNFIKEFDALVDISEYLNTSRANIKKVCKSSRKSTDGKVEYSVKGYITCYKDDYLKNKYKFDNSIAKKKVLDNIKYLNRKAKKRIYQYDLKGNFIKEYESGADADRELEYNEGDCSNIAARNVRNEYLQSIHGYYWFWNKVDFNKFEKVKRKNGIISLKINK